MCQGLQKGQGQKIIIFPTIRYFVKEGDRNTFFLHIQCVNAMWRNLARQMLCIKAVLF